jgi:hypothetical protein
MKIARNSAGQILLKGGKPSCSCCESDPCNPDGTSKSGEHVFDENGLYLCGPGFSIPPWSVTGLLHSLGLNYASSNKLDGWAADSATNPVPTFGPVSAPPTQVHNTPSTTWSPWSSWFWSHIRAYPYSSSLVHSLRTGGLLHFAGLNAGSASGFSDSTIPVDIYTLRNRDDPPKSDILHMRRSAATFGATVTVELEYWSAYSTTFQADFEPSLSSPPSPPGGITLHQRVKLFRFVGWPIAQRAPFYALLPDLETLFGAQSAYVVKRFRWGLSNLLPTLAASGPSNFVGGIYATPPLVLGADPNLVYGLHFRAVAVSSAQGSMTNGNFLPTPVNNQNGIDDSNWRIPFV